jgi:hypothetical protein
MPASEVIENVVPQSKPMLRDENGARNRNVRFIDQIGQARIDKIELGSWVRKDRHMFSARRLQFKGRSRADGDVARFPDEPKVLSQNDDGSLRMGDEGCPNESPSVDDATGYSKEEEEADSIACEEAS